VAEEIIKDKDCTLVWVVRKTSEKNHEYASDFLGVPQARQGKFYSKEEALNPDFFRNNPVDVLIDFSSTDGVYEYAAAADCGIRIVSAISRYGAEEKEFLKTLSGKTAVLHSPNITLGVNFLMVASQVLQQIIPHADIEIVEEHFRDKKDVSGTALKIAEELGLDPVSRVNSIRVGGIVGKHEVIFGLPYQTIRITHEAISRSAFGTGALYAAKGILESPPGLYTMEGLIHKAFVRKIMIDELLV
jgi:4-hydroxy-tetrahydrodipicolinate reductase